jgi:Tfp pilus assembly protein PilO
MAIKMDAIYGLPRSKKVAILVVLICVVIGLYAYAFFIPQQNELSRLKGELNNLVRELNESKAIAKDLEKFKKQIEQLNLELTSALTNSPMRKKFLKF